MIAKILTSVAGILPYLFVFVISLSHSLDPDLGCYLMYGEHFIRTGEILKEKAFSSNMSDFK